MRWHGYWVVHKSVFFTNSLENIVAIIKFGRRINRCNRLSALRPLRQKQYTPLSVLFQRVCRPGPFDGGIIVVFEADGVATNLVMNQQYIYLLIKDPNYNVE